jgi:hypothetical protein
MVYSTNLNHFGKLQTKGDGQQKSIFLTQAEWIYGKQDHMNQFIVKHCQEHMNDKSFHSAQRANIYESDSFVNLEDIVESTTMKTYVTKQDKKDPEDDVPD